MNESPYNAPAANLLDDNRVDDVSVVVRKLCRELLIAFYCASLLVFPMLVLCTWMMSVPMHGYPILAPLGAAASYPVNFIEAPDDRLGLTVALEFAWIFIWILIVRGTFKWLRR